MSIHFASLFCTDYDLDLAPHWIRHYLDMGLDTYTVWLHSPSGDTATMFEIHKLFRRYGVQCLIATGDFNDGHLRIDTIEPFAQRLDSKDLLVVADSDELHDCDREHYERFEVTRGLTVDRYDHTLHAARPGDSLFKQYPLEGDVQEQVINSIPSNAQIFWPKVNKNKICCALAGLPVAFGGSHTLYPDAATGSYPEVIESEPIKAWHFCWRDSILKRMAGKHYYDAASIWYVWEFFGGKRGQEPPELLDKIEAEETMQRQKGWEPVLA